MRISDWSSDVCSSDLRLRPDAVRGEFVPRACEIGVGHPHPGEGTAPFALPAVRAGMDQRRLVTAIPGTILRRRDDRDRAIGFETEVEPAQWIGEHRRAPIFLVQIGRAACREREWQYV